MPVAAGLPVEAGLPDAAGGTLNDIMPDAAGGSPDAAGFSLSHGNNGIGVAGKYMYAKLLKLEEPSGDLDCACNCWLPLLGRSVKPSCVNGTEAH